MRKLWWLAVLPIFIAGAALADYAATQGSGTNFASNVISTAHYMASMLCDATLGKAQCATVNGAGQVSVTGPVTQSGTWNTRLQDGAGNSINSTSGSLNTNVTNLNINGIQPSSGSAPVVGASDQFGTAADASCGTDTGTCTLIALHKRLNTLVDAPPPLGTTSGGWTPLVKQGLSTTVLAIKASGGWLGRVMCYNPNASEVFVQVFNVASGSVTLGTTVPADFVPLAPTTTTGWVMALPGEQFGTAISAAATTTWNGSTAPGSAVDCTFAYN